MKSWQLGSPDQSEIMSMRLQKIDEGPEVQRLDRFVCAPVLKRIPRMWSTQDERSAARIHEVIRIRGKSKRSSDWRLDGVGAGNAIGKFCYLCRTAKQEDNEYEQQNEA